MNKYLFSLAALVALSGALVLAQGSVRIRILGTVGEPPPIGTETLTVTKSGDGTGTVTSSPSGINCGGDCSEVYTANTVVTLTPTPDANNAFAGWSGNADCSDGTVTVSASFTCDAAFDTDPPTPPTGIEGYGSVTAGCDSGSSPSIVNVTNLSPNGVGSLKHAIDNADGTGTCIRFTTSGTITLTSDLDIVWPYITIDCNTSASGITVDHGGGQYQLNVTSSTRDVTDLIFRGCTFDGGSPVNDESLYGFQWRFHRVGGNDLSRVIMNNNTFTRTGDGAVECWSGGGTADGPSDFTIQNNLFLDIHFASNESYGCRRWTVHRNLWTDNGWRQPFIGGGAGNQDLDFVNNIVWGWGCPSGARPAGGNGTQIQTAQTLVFNLKFIKNIYAVKSGCSSSQEGAIHHASGPAHAGYTVRYDSNDMPVGETNDVNVGTVPNTPAYAQTTEFTTAALCQEILVDNPVGPDNLTSAASSAISAARTQFGC